MDGSFIPPGRAQGRGLKDQLVICTIWSQGKEYHFIFRGKKARALAHAHTCSHLLRGSNSISGCPPVSSNPPPPTNFLHAYCFTNLYMSTQMFALSPSISLLIFFFDFLFLNNKSKNFALIIS